MFATSASEAYKLAPAGPKSHANFAQGVRRLAGSATEYRYPSDGQRLYLPRPQSNLRTLVSPSLKARLDSRPGGAVAFRSQEPLAAFGPKVSLYKELTAKYGLVLKPRAQNSLPRLSMGGRPEEFKPYQPEGWTRREKLFSELRDSSLESMQANSCWPRSEPASSTMRSALLYPPHKPQGSGLSPLVTHSERVLKNPEPKLSLPQSQDAERPHPSESTSRAARAPVERRVETANVLSTPTVNSGGEPQVLATSSEPVQSSWAPHTDLSENFSKATLVPDERRTASTAEQRTRECFLAKSSAGEPASHPPIFNSQRSIPFRMQGAGTDRTGHARSRSFVRETPERESATRKGDSGPRSQQEGQESALKTPMLHCPDSPAESGSSIALLPHDKEQVGSVPPSLLVEQSRSYRADDLSFAEGAESVSVPSSPSGQTTVAVLGNSKGWYAGETTANQMDGLGRLFDADGELVYEGWLSANQFDGLGTISLKPASTSHFERPWQNLDACTDSLTEYQGEFSQSCFNGQGFAKYCDNGIYFGAFKDGLPHGHGIWSNGQQTVCGVWTAGVFIDDI